jgi:phospholipid/cholesterol/gamma-HCH transport system ATP-binding protein
VLSGVNLGIPEGLITVVMGPSGTGKSVLLRHFIGLLNPDAGEVRVRGRALHTMSFKELLELRTRCGVLFQDGALWGSMNLFDNVALPLRQHTNLPERAIAEVVRTQLGRVGLADAEDRLSHQLSGGMRKRAGLARALVLDPEIIFFDEPDSGLDPVRTSLLADLVATMHAQLGGTYVLITHNIALARQIADYVAVLWHGQIVQAGMSDDLFASPDPFVRQFLAGTADGPLGMD